MVKRKGGSRRKSRDKFKKGHRRKGKVSFTAYLQKYQPGDRVNLVIEPSVHKGMFHARFAMKSGRVLAKRGFCYEVLIKDGNKEKMLIIHPVHLKKQEQN